MPREAGCLLLFALLPFTLRAEDGHVGTHPVSFPADLHGTWYPAPHDCNANGGDGNDMRFDFSAGTRQNFEDIETFIDLAEFPGVPRTWRLTTRSNVVGDDTGQARIYVLGPRYLFVTDGERVDRYVQCE